MGGGPPLVKTANWMNHLEFDWESPDLRHLYTALARDFTLLRYDARGNGLSDWDVEDVSLDAWVKDLETVVDAAGLDRFPLLGMSQGCAISVAFAVRHPERVSHLVLYGGFARGAYRRAKNELELQQAKALATLDPHRMGQREPGISSAVLVAVHARRHAGTAATICRAAAQDDDGRMRLPLFRDHQEPGRERVAAKVSVPTLVMHKRDDQVQPFEAGRELAAGIPGARFVALPGQNHMPLAQDPETERMLEEIRLFLKTVTDVSCATASRRPCLDAGGFHVFERPADIVAAAGPERRAIRVSRHL